MTDVLDRASIKNGVLFGSIIAVTTVVVVVLYGWIYGFTPLARNAQGAGRLLTAGATAQPGGAVPFQVYPGQARPAARAPVAGQYVCPLHGAVGMPVYGQGGSPQCPVCGQTMQFISPGYPAAPVAWRP